MEVKQQPPTPLFCIRCSRFMQSTSWRLRDLSISALGKIAVSGGNINTYQTFIEVFSGRCFELTDKPVLMYMREFEKYETQERIYYLRYVSFIDLDCEESQDDKLLTCLGNKLDIIRVSTNEILRSRTVKGVARCLSVRENEIFIGFFESKKVTIYDITNLNEMKSVVIKDIQDGEFPFEMYITKDEMFVCAGKGGEDRPLLVRKKNGELLAKFTNTSNRQPFARSVTVSEQFGVVAFVWSHSNKEKEWNWQVLLYLVKENYSFLTFDVEKGVSPIRMSRRADKMITGNRVTGEVKIFDMAQLFSYHNMKQNLASQLQMNDCARLINHFAPYKDQSDAIVKSGTPTANLLLALEERGVIQSSNVGRLVKAFHELNITSKCYHLVNFYQHTRIQATSYDRFLATLSTHLTASLPGELCVYFNISDEKKNIIKSSQNPGLALLLDLDEREIIKSSNVAALEQPFNKLKLIQAVAKIHEYRSIVERANNQLQREAEITEDRKREYFVQCLQRKIKSWYETMTPVPWKKSCKWSLTDLFVSRSLIFTDSKSKRNLLDVDERCKVESKQILCHTRLKSETRIILEGDPGSGKTMLVTQMAYDWSQGKVSDIKILILLPLKFVQQMTLVEAIKDFYMPGDKRLSISDIEHFFWEEETPTYLLLDGLEEYSSKLTHETQEKSELGEIMSKVKYPSCKVLLSSRSDFAKDLPKVPMLKLDSFGEKERSSYIERLFPDDLVRQIETKQVISDSPIVQELCSVPLLFVLVVHNAENMGKVQFRRLNRVTPFVKVMVDILYPLTSSIIKTQQRDLRDKVLKDTSLEELAYNGLCRGFQQLYWQKEFLDEKIQNIKEWIDSGILVVEESNSAVQRYKKDQLLESVATKSGDTKLTKEEEESRPSVLQKVAKGQLNVEQSERRVAEGFGKDPDEETMSYDNGKQRGSDTKHVPLQVRFLHKIIQEWFAAKYLSCMISNVSKNLQERYLFEQLSLINPADLHFLLRFTCAFHPPSCHTIIKTLLRYRTKEGHVPEYIMNCTFLCLAEYTGEHNSNILGVMSDVCKECITIRSEDSRLLQQAKVGLLKLVSSRRIRIRKLLLADLVVSARHDVLIFNSGVKLTALDTLEMMEISRWDQILNAKDYSNILKFIANSFLRKASLYFPYQPPRVDQKTAISLQEDNKTVTWTIGSKLSLVLDPAQGKWMVDSNKEEKFSCGVTQKVGNKALLQQTLPGTEATITKNSATVTIPSTMVELNIPSGALPDHVDECVIKMRIIPLKEFKDPTITFSSNSSVVVEILPNNLTLQRPAQLKIPHCLLLKENEIPTAKIFMSHHEEGCQPCWEEHSNIDYRVERTHCVVLLNRFCWVKIKVDEKEVLAKKLILYTCGEKLRPTDSFSTIVVGYYPDLDGEGKFLSLNKSMTVSERSPFNFMKEGSHPLCLLLAKFESSQWKLWFPEDGNWPQVISFDEMCSSDENRRKFILRKTVADAASPMCIFQASQEQGQKLQLQICPELLHHSSSYHAVAPSPSGSHSEPQIKSEKDAMNSTFRYLSKELEQKWLQLGRELNVPDADLHNIQAENSVTVDAIYKMLLRWKQKEGSGATYAILIKSLEKAGRKDLAENVANRKDLSN